MPRGYRRLTHMAREQLPARTVRTAKGGVLALGRATARLRMLPSLLIIGGQRCGTTTLFRVLSDHPQIRRPTVSKGTGYFESNYQKGPNWYRGHFPLARPNTITFESSGYYSFHPLAAERIGQDLPGVRVVMMVRDPVERAFSAYKHEYARGYEDRPFEQALELEAVRIAGEAERIQNDPGYESFSLRHHAYVTRGQYAEQLDRFAGAVDPDNLYVLDAGRFFVDSIKEFELLNEWLGLSPWIPGTIGQWNARQSDPMPDNIRVQLSEHFMPYDLALTKYLGRTPSWV